MFQVWKDRVLGAAAKSCDVHINAKGDYETPFPQPWATQVSPGTLQYAFLKEPVTTKLVVKQGAAELARDFTSPHEEGSPRR